MYNTEEYHNNTMYKMEYPAAAGTQDIKHPNSMVYMPELLQPESTARVNKSHILKHPLTGFTSSPRMTMGKTQFGGVFKKESTASDVHSIIMQSP